MFTTRNQRKPCSLSQQHRLSTAIKTIIVPGDSAEDGRDERDLVDPDDVRDAIIGIILRGCPKRGVR